MQCAHLNRVGVCKMQIFKYILYYEVNLLFLVILLATFNGVCKLWAIKMIAVKKGVL